MKRSVLVAAPLTREWWVMAKKGKAYGLMVDLQKPPMPQIPAKEDVPRMLERVTDLKTVMANFEAMAV